MSHLPAVSYEIGVHRCLYSQPSCPCISSKLLARSYSLAPIAVYKLPACLRVVHSNLSSAPVSLLTIGSLHHPQIKQAVGLAQTFWSHSEQENFTLLSFCYNLEHSSAVDTGQPRNRRTNMKVRSQQPIGARSSYSYTKTKI